MVNVQRSADRALSRPSPDSLVLDLADQGVRNERVLDAFTQVRREIFVPVEFSEQAYDDIPIIIGHDQVTTQPSLVAMMVQALDLKGQEKVLEIGTGFGFQLAILAHLCAEVFSVERYPDLAMTAESNLKKAKIKNVKVVVGDGTLGLPKHSSYDAIIVSAAAPNVPRPLIGQLKEGGRLVQPIGPGGNETVVVFQKERGRLIKIKELTKARFVPLVGTFAGRVVR